MVVIDIYLFFLLYYIILFVCFFPFDIYSTERFYMSGFNIDVGLDLSSNGDLGGGKRCKHIPTRQPRLINTYVCDSVLRGRWVYIKRLEKYKKLHLCEVQVYGKKVPTLTYGGNAKGAECSFPFTYNNTQYRHCIDPLTVNGSSGVEGRVKPWCLTGNTTEEQAPANQTWGYCMGE